MDDASLARMLSQRVEVLQDATEASFGKIPKPVLTRHEELLAVESSRWPLFIRIVCGEWSWNVLPDGAPLPDEKTLSTVAEAHGPGHGAPRHPHLLAGPCAVFSRTSVASTSLSSVRRGPKTLYNRPAIYWVETRGYSSVWIASSPDGEQTGAMVDTGYGDALTVFANE